MAGFDDPGVYFSDSFFSDDRNDGQQTRTAFQKKFKDFIKTFMDHQSCFCYR